MRIFVLAIALLFAGLFTVLTVFEIRNNGLDPLGVLAIVVIVIFVVGIVGALKNPPKS